MLREILVLFIEKRDLVSYYIQYNFIQQPTGKLFNAMKTHSDQFMIRYKKMIRNNEINIGKNNVITAS